MLTDDEVARVETTPRLVAGDEYLEHLDKGVRHALGMVPAAATLLAKKAVSDTTWTKILT